MSSNAQRRRHALLVLGGVALGALVSMVSVGGLLYLIAHFASGEADSVGPDRSAPTTVVTKVVDGDTIEVRVSGGIEKVRLLGIDTP